MEQLKMYWKAVPTEWPTAKPGWSYRRYNGSEADAQAWMAICRNGLLRPQDTREVFDTYILQKPGFAPDRLFFVEHEGRPVASITALLEENGQGDLHMVGALPECRGQGVGGLLCRIAQASLWQCGCSGVWLTTDEFRVPAICSYLSAGFLPVEYAEEMEYRWDILLRFLGRTNVPFVNEQGQQIKLLNTL